LCVSVATRTALAAALKAAFEAVQLRYIEAMFEVLVYVYENYWQGDACPEPRQLGRKLSAAGFEAEEIEEALVWLGGLQLAAWGSRGVSPSGEAASQSGPVQVEPLRTSEGTPPSTEPSTEPSAAPQSIAAQPPLPQSPGSLRVYSVAEQDHLGAESLGFVSFLESAGVLPSHMREIVMDRAMAAPGEPLSLDDLKIIVLMVYWSVGAEPDALVLDELCDESEGRVAH
jgi:Smg protein